MVKRYTKYRKPVFREAPWWERNVKGLVGWGVVAVTAWMYIPAFNMLRIGSKSKQCEILDPRTGEDLREIRRKFKEREKDLINSPTPRF